MNKGLVSIIVPCYNVEKVIGRCLESILNQTYKKIEIIIVNDGSTDNTEKIILSHKKKFNEKNMIFKYIYQDNKGLGGAINTGLKYFTGEYLSWPDADDTLDLSSIEKKVEFLKKNPEYACVTSDANMYDETDLLNPIQKISDIYQHNYDENQFEYLLLGKSIFCPGCHMIRTNAFLDVNPSREIFEARRGQNWQMLLPVYYKYKRGFINEPLYNYIIYKNSMSRGDDTKEKRIKRENECYEIIQNTLSKMKISENDRKKFLKLFYSKIYIVNIFDICMEYKDFKVGFKYYIKMIKEHTLRKYDTKYFIKSILKK